ncbi:hypothetical protein [Caudoviricetes sp.]|nr:hypothetical protein [Caudoviricetes sp.]UOF82778.1 hypothetical protein [Caudoviricetes sp.]
MSQKLSPAGERVNELLEIQSGLEEWIKKLIEYHYGLDKQTTGAVDLPMQDLVDLGFLHRELADRLDEVRKECAARMDKVSRIIGGIVIKRTTMDPTLSMTQRGTLASGTPEAKVLAVCPKPGSPEYVALLRAMGVKDDAIKAGALAPHFVRMSDYVSEKLASGQPAPAGILGTSPTFRVTYIRKRANNG